MSNEPHAHEREPHDAKTQPEEVVRRDNLKQVLSNHWRPEDLPHRVHSETQADESP